MNKYNTQLPTDHKGVSTIRRVEACTDEQVKQAHRWRKWATKRVM